MIIAALYWTLLGASLLLLVTAGFVASTWWRIPITDPVTFWLFVGVLFVAGTAAFALWNWGPR